MLVIPAIDLKGGRCVRLIEGRAETAKVYDRDPIEVARSYEHASARLIHIVDLDGAFLGTASQNREIVQRIVGEIDIPVEVGGGIRSLADIEALVENAGSRYIVLGTVAVEKPDLVRTAVERFGDAIVVGIDARGSSVATRGWTHATGTDAIDLAQQMAGLGVTRIIYTDISRDGKLEGPNLDATREIARKTGLKVTASGGVSSLDDIARLCELERDGVESVIVGKALYEGRFTLEQAISVATRVIS